MAVKASDKLIGAITRYQAGDDSAFDTIYYESIQYITRCVLNVVNKTAAGASEDVKQDIIQETYMVVATKLHTLQKPESFLQWAGQTATRLAERTWIRDSRRYQQEIPEEELLYEPVNEDFIPEDILQNREKQRIIRKILEELPTTQYLCVIEYFYNGLKEAQVAQKLDLPLNTVKTNLRRAKQKLKAAIETTEKTEGIRLHSMGWLLWLYFLQDMRATVSDPKQQAALLSRIRSGMGAATAGTGASAAAAGTSAAGAASSAAASGGTAAGFLATLGGKITAVAVAAAITVGAVAGGIAAGSRNDSPSGGILQEDISSQVPEGFPVEKADVDADLLDRFYSFFATAREDLVGTQDMRTYGNGYTARIPVITGEFTGSSGLNDALYPEAWSDYFTFPVHGYHTIFDVAFTGKSLNGLLFIEDDMCIVPGVALNLISGQVYTAADLFRIYACDGKAPGVSLESYIEEFYRSLIGTDPAFSEQGLALTLAPDNLVKTFMFTAPSTDLDYELRFRLPLLNVEGKAIDEFWVDLYAPDSYLVTSFQEGLLYDGKTAYRIPHVNLDTPGARELNDRFQSYADTAEFEGCYSLNYKTWVSGNILVIEQWCEVFGSHSTNTCYLNLTTGEVITSDDLLAALGMTPRQLAERILPAVTEHYATLRGPYTDFPQTLIDQTLSPENLENSTLVLREDGSVDVRYTYYHPADTGRSQATISLMETAGYYPGFLEEFLSSNPMPELQQMLETILEACRLNIGRMDYAAWVSDRHLLIGIARYDTSGQWLGADYICADLITGVLMDAESVMGQYGLDLSVPDHALRCYIEHGIGPGYVVQVPATLPPETEPVQTEASTAEVTEAPTGEPTEFPAEDPTETPTEAPDEAPVENTDDPLMNGNASATMAASDALWYAENYWGLISGEYPEGVSIVCDNPNTDTYYPYYYTFRLIKVNPVTGAAETVDTVTLDSQHGLVYNP